jgi:transcriptional regulator with XRE-family HTH domain
VAEDSTPESASTDRGSLAWKLNRLFETVHPPGRGPYSPEEVARAITERGEFGKVSTAYIYMLKRGERDNPTKRHLEALADFFGVKPAYFYDDAATARIDQQLELIAAFREGEIRTLAARASGLSPSSLGGILQMVDAARKIEGLPANPDRPESPSVSGSDPDSPE